MLENGPHELGAQVAASMVGRHDYIEDQSLVYAIGQNAGECGEPAGAGFAKSDSEVGMSEHPSHVFPRAPFRPPLFLIEPDEVLDLGITQPGDGFVAQMYARRLGCSTSG